ncbi:MAG: GTPase ObgE, partial [Candidatus Gastranaerophilales bacterium]|nr:GTPase ObgE [Candidatus Gastranaerophilales bacterium]
LPISDENLSTLLDFRYKSRFQAGIGDNGRNKNQHGKSGEDLYIKVPVGTIVKDPKTGKNIADLKHHEDKVLVAKGGRGGRGNSRFASSIKRSPQFCEPGEPGIERDLELELKLIADVGLLGMPNAGKSTLISVISAAKPKIADYPFTTLVPNLGVVQKPNGDSFVVADIPGLIEGASEGVGLGHDFLRHVDRTRFLIHIVDMLEPHPFHNYQVINNELKKYSERLGNAYQIIALNKADSTPQEIIDHIKDEFKQENKDIFVISAATKQGIDEFLNFVYNKVDEIPPPEIEIELDEDFEAYNNDDSEFEIIKDKKAKAYYVIGGKVGRLASVTDERNNEQVYRLQNILIAMGVFEELKKQGIKDGDTVVVGSIEFAYYDDEYTEETE